MNDRAPWRVLVYVGKESWHVLIRKKQRRWHRNSLWVIEKRELSRAGGVWFGRRLRWCKSSRAKVRSKPRVFYSFLRQIKYSVFHVLIIFSAPQDRKVFKLLKSSQWLLKKKKKNCNEQEILSGDFLLLFYFMG